LLEFEIKKPKNKRRKNAEKRKTERTSENLTKKLTKYSKKILKPEKARTLVHGPRPNLTSMCAGVNRLCC
jgi:hypothetical protein